MEYYFFRGNNLMKTKIEELRSKYMNNPPEGMTVKDIRNMIDDDLQNMDYFPDDNLDDDFGEDGFYIFLITNIILCFSYLNAYYLKYVR